MSDFDVLVEANIDAIRTDVSKKEIYIDFMCACLEQGRRRLTAKGVDNFVVNEMRLSNIVDRVTKIGSREIDGDIHESASRIFFLLRGQNPTQGDLEWDILEEKLSLIREGHLIFLEVEPVYGATILILAENIILEQCA